MHGQKLEQRESMHGVVYDELMNAILHIIHKLNLSSIKESDSELEVLLLLKINYVLHKGLAQISNHEEVSHAKYDL